MTVLDLIDMSRRIALDQEVVVSWEAHPAITRALSPRRWPYMIFRRRRREGIALELMEVSP